MRMLLPYFFLVAANGYLETEMLEDLCGSPFRNTSKYLEFTGSCFIEYRLATAMFVARDTV